MAIGDFLVFMLGSYVMSGLVSVLLMSFPSRKANLVNAE